METKFPNIKILVTGGAGFIGSEFIRQSLRFESATRIINLDKLTYSGNLENLEAIKSDPRYRFVRGDVSDMSTVEGLFDEERPEIVVHFAAESHVDRSVLSPDPVIRTNVLGTFALLEASRKYGVERFVQVSSDEVYGSIDEPFEADELFPLKPSSPYSASKASADLLALSYLTTYGVPVVVTRASNNYGPFQFPEKLIPLMISNALSDQLLPIYGDGLQVRDWLYVADHCEALKAVILDGQIGEIYNISGNCRLTNREVVVRLLELLGKPKELMRTVTDRPGHDRRYAMRAEKIARDTTWHPRTSFNDGLSTTIQWYRENPEWIKQVRSGDYETYYQRQYAHRIHLDEDD
jgi:dTDP-glucose 4,6-dehydratase